MEDKEKVIKKIENLLTLAGNNPSMQEAAAAAIKAQELMAKYHIEYADMQDGSGAQKIVKTVHTLQRGHHDVCKWRYFLSEIVAGNFCCRTYLEGSGRKSVVFYGYEKDAQAAAEVFRFLYETGNRLAMSYYRKCRREGRPAKGVRNAYLYGFCRGIQEILEKQGSALMTVVPKRVEEAWKGMEGNLYCEGNTLRIAKDGHAYAKGKASGRTAAASRGIEG